MSQEKLDLCRKINDDVNQQIHWTPDSEIYGIPDYWPTGIETIGITKEDCDGQAIAKAHILWDQYGFSQDEITLGLCQVMDSGTGNPGWHMICMYWEIENDPWILDNGAVSYNVVKYSAIKNLMKLRAWFNKTNSGKLQVI